MWHQNVQPEENLKIETINANRHMQEPKEYWSHPRYLLCIKSRLQISADDPGMPLNNADVLV